MSDYDDNEPFLDMPEEAQLDSNGRTKQAPPVVFTRPPIQRPPNPVQEEPVESYDHVEFDVSTVESLTIEDEEAEDNYEEILSNASLRLEQGNLYKLIMNHNMFENSDADPRAIKNVQKQIRKFAKEQMELMLGMRQATSIVEHLEIDFPFNEREVQALKMVAKTVTNGASEHSDKFVPAVTRTKQEVENVPKKNVFNPIGGGGKKPAPQVTQPMQRPSKPFQRKPAAPVQRTRMDNIIDKIAREEGIPRELLEENVPGVGGKNLDNMSESELIERNKLISQRRGQQVRNPQALPMATPQQQERMAEIQAGSANGLVSRLIDVAKNMPITTKE